MHRKTNFLVNLYWDNKYSDSDSVCRVSELPSPSQESHWWLGVVQVRGQPSKASCILGRNSPKLQNTCGDTEIAESASCLCAYVCVCVCVRACVRACIHVCVWLLSFFVSGPSKWQGNQQVFSNNLTVATYWVAIKTKDPFLTLRTTSSGSLSVTPTSLDMYMKLSFVT